MQEPLDDVEGGSAGFERLENGGTMVHRVMNSHEITTAADRNRKKSGCSFR